MLVNRPAHAFFFELERKRVRDGKGAVYMTTNDFLYVNLMCVERNDFIKLALISYPSLPASEKISEHCFPADKLPKLSP